MKTKRLNNRAWFAGYVVIALACLTMPATAWAQLTIQRKSNYCTASDKLEVTSFTVTPTQLVSGQSVKVVMKIKNKCPSGTASLNVPWIIKRDNTQISSGTETLAPGSTSADLIGNWTAATGTFTFWGSADPNRTISETERNNNTTNDYKVTVGTSSASTASTQPVLVSQLLDHVKAKNAGANFTANALEFTLCGLRTNGGKTGSEWGNEQVLSEMACGSAVGGRGDYEGYSGFTLKNGWKVKSYEIVPSPVSEYRESDHKGWSWVSSPQVGSTNPYYKLRLWVSADGRTLQIFMRITIEGPQGTSPYQ